MTTGRFNSVKGGGTNWKTVKRAQREEREELSKEEHNLRQFAQQFVEQNVQLRRQGKTAEAAEILDALHTANPHLARIVAREAKGRN